MNNDGASHAMGHARHSGPPAYGVDSGWRHAVAGPVPTDTDDAVQAISRTEHVNAELFKRFMKDSLGRQAVAVVLMPLLVIICWPYAAPGPLLAWLAVGLCVATMRLIATRIYARRYPGTAPRTRSVYVRYFMAVWLARALVWGASVVLFFDRIPIDKQYLCWVVAISAIGFPITIAALRISVMRRYLATAFAAALACIAWRVATTASVEHYELWAVPLALLGCAMLLRIGETIHANTRENLELVFDKTQLIDSLARKREEAEEAVKRKNRFLASAAHDMRQPVLALNIYAEHLIETPTQHRIVVPKIACAAAAVDRLFHSLFDLARMDNGQSTLRIAPIDIAEIMQDLLVQYEPMAQAKSIQLKMRTGRCEIATDAVRARRMIGNLVCNAIKYSPIGTKVLMSARVRAHGVVIDVWDQGIGIPVAELDCVFHEFYKAGNAGENSEGFGLGLSIVSRLAQALNSRLSVRSQQGRGSVFRLVMNSVDDAANRLIPGSVG